MPKFATPLARAKADKLMQPALIRVIDNIRKQLDQSTWQGNYEEELIWPEGTTPEQQQEYIALQKLLHGVPPEEHDRVSALMSALPQPSPLYTLRLTREHFEDHTVDIWALCYRVCALTSYPENEEAAQEITLEADDNLFDELGEVDWLKLDEKTKGLIEGIFADLPA
ncbi:MAG: hypothetical protein AAGB19_16355 [Cyanobacteria bacterium P01_F01_bin.3]